MTDDEQRQLRAAVLLDLHESNRSVRLHSVRVVQLANAYETAARTLRKLADHKRLDDIALDAAVIDAIPIPDDLRRAVADLVMERTRRREARGEQAACLDLLDD